MGIKHSSTATHGSKGLATQWNDDHVIDDDVDAANHKIKNLAAPTANNDAARLTDILSPPGTVPIGGVLAWLKSYTNTPALPVNFVECNGQVLADIASVYNGQAIPDLNTGANKRFLRGSATSGTTGGANTNAHTHSVTPNTKSQPYQNMDINRPADTTAITTSGPSDTNILPSYYEVVWIMRVK